MRKADDFFWNRRGPIHFGVTEKFLRCMHACLHAPCMRCSYHSGHRACMRMTSIASRTYLCDPTTVVSQRDCSSPSGTLAVRRVDDSLWNRRGQIRSDVTEKFGSACMHACTMHALLVPFCQACVQAPRMRVHACARTILSCCWRMQGARCSYHSGHRACMRMTSRSASRTYPCDPITVVSQRDCSSPSGTLAVRRVDDSLWNRRGQKFGSACMHACTMHALLVPFCQACVQAPRMRMHACAHTILSCCWRMQGARTSHTLPRPPQCVRFTDVPRTVSGAHVCMHLACAGIRTYHSALHAPNTPRARRSTASA